MRFATTPATEIQNLLAALHCAVVIDQLADDARRMEPSQPDEVDRGLGMARAHQNAARFGDEREDMAGAHEVRRLHIAVGERVDGGGALLG